MSISFSNHNLAIVVPIMALLCLQLSCDSAGPSATLEYVVDLDAKRDAAPPDMQKLVDVINRRLAGVASAKATTDNKLKVDILETVTEDELKDIRRGIETVGELQFRITACPAFEANQEIIEAAQTLSADQNELWIGDKKVAEWMEYAISEFGTVEQNHARVVKRKANNLSQALVLMNDGFDVTGKYLEECSQGIDEQGNPQVNFKFNDIGAFRFGRLTGEYLPHEGKFYPLAIIFNQKILSAPIIRSRIHSHGRISGIKDMKDVDFIVSVLKAGSLPYPIRLTREQSSFRNWHEEIDQ